MKAARKAARLTQVEAAALCGVSMPFMNQLEGGKRQHLSVTRVLKVCAALGVCVQVSWPKMAAEPAPPRIALPPKGARSGTPSHKKPDAPP